jgi:hypothetical protein
MLPRPFHCVWRAALESSCTVSRLLSPAEAAPGQGEWTPTRKRRREQKEPPAATIPLAEVRCHQQLGGLLKHYYRKAA